MKKFTIYTECRNRSILEKEFSNSFPSFTTYTGRGYYDYMTERSLIFVVITEDITETRLNIDNFCRYVCCVNEQIEVLVTEEDAKVTLIGQSGIL